jgi:parallel beta-helix repeat protein
MRHLEKCVAMLCAALAGAAFCAPLRADAASLCVNPAGSGGCYSSIQTALNAANPFDVVTVANGTYYESLTIAKPVTLIGENDDRTVIDAVSRANGIYIDGLDNPGLRRVVVSRFRIEHATFEGVLATDASYLTISDNDIVDNDQGLTVVNDTPSCAGLPPFETGEDFDCGEAVHLIGVTHSTIAGNEITGNAGGILLSDETGSTTDNVISENVVERNPYECGITLAAHPSYPTPLAGYVISRNTIADNDVSKNGLQGEGAGVGFFAVPFAGGVVTQNVAIHNRLVGNSIPGVAFHSHAPGDNLNNNAIIENYIAYNGADRDDTATSGPTGINVQGASPIRGTLILENVIEHEAIDVAVRSDALVSVHLNAFDTRGGAGVRNLGTGTVDAVENWWGCPAGPASAACAQAAGPDIVVTPWLHQPFNGTDDGDRHHDHHGFVYEEHDDHDHH